MVVGSSAAAPEAAAPRAFLAGAAVLYTARFGIKKSQSKSTRSMNIRPKITRGRRNLRWGAAAPPCRAGERPRLTPAPGAPREEGSGGAGRARPGLRPPSGRARGCGRRHAGRRRAGLWPRLGAASPGHRARPLLEAAPPPRERREREEARMRTRERAGLAWKPRRHREKGGRGRRHGCGRERELGFGPSIYLAAEWLGRRQEHRSSGIRGVKIILLPWTPCAPVLATRSILFKCNNNTLTAFQKLGGLICSGACLGSDTSQFS